MSPHTCIIHFACDCYALYLWNINCWCDGQARAHSQTQVRTLHMESRRDLTFNRQATPPVKTITVLADNCLQKPYLHKLDKHHMCGGGDGLGGSCCLALALLCFPMSDLPTHPHQERESPSVYHTHPRTLIFFNLTLMSDSWLMIYIIKVSLLPYQF